MSELLLSFYPSVKSLLSLLPRREIPAIHILLLGLARAEQYDGLIQSLLEVNRKMLADSAGLQIRSDTLMPKNQGLVVVAIKRSCQRIFRVPPTPLSTLAILWQL